jgi:hypothetical protein
MSEAAEATAPEPQVATPPTNFIDALESYFRVTAFGLIVTNQQIPAHVMWEAMAAAMGAVISGATKSQDIAATLSAREHLSKVMTDAVKKRYPALDMGNIASVAANSNGLRGY